MPFNYSMRSFCIGLLLLGIASQFTHAQNKVKLVNPNDSREWYQFRGPDGMGHSDATGIATEWDADTNIKWKKAIPGSGWSSPVIVEGKIYLTAAVKEDDITLHAICIDAESGDIDWDRVVFTPDPDEAKIMHSKNSLASPTPIVHEHKLFVHFGHMGTAALDLDGTIVWKQTEVKYHPMHGNGGTPVIVDDKIVFSCDGKEDPFVIALNTDSGDIEWKTPRNTFAQKPFSLCTPLVIEADGMTQIISPGSGFVGSYDPGTGKELWRVNYGEGYSVVPRPVLAHDMIFVSSSFNDAVMYGVNPIGAKHDSTKTHRVWDNRRGAPHTPSVIVDGDELYMVSDGGVASCLDAKTGKTIWSERLGGNFSASPILVEDRLYFLNETGTCFVVKADKEYELIAQNDLDERTLASPAVYGSALYIRSDQHLWRIEN